MVLRKLRKKFINLDEMLRDKLVNGLKDMQTQRRFFEISEEKLTLEKAEQIALAVEKVNKNAKLLNQESVTESQGASGIASEERIHRSGRSRDFTPSSKANKFDKDTKSQGKNIECYRCGGPHFARDCTRKQSLRCDCCGSRGHTTVKYMTKVVKNIDSEPGNCETEGCSDEDDCYSVFYSKEAKANGPYTVELSCNGKPIRMEVDTGASCTLMGQSDFEDLQSSLAEPIHLVPYEKPVRTNTKEDISHTRDNQL